MLPPALKQKYEVVILVWLIILQVVLGLLGLFLAYIFTIIISALLVNMKKEYPQESRLCRE